MALLAGAPVDVTDFSLPDTVGGFGNGTNEINATAWTALPTTPLAVDITNPHPTAEMLCLVTLGAWGIVGTSDARVSIAMSGAANVAAGIGGGGPIGWGEVLQITGSTSEQQQAVWPVELPPGTTTLTVVAYVSADGGTQQVNYPTLRVIPLRYLA